MQKLLIVNTAFYIYGNIRLKEISILNSFEQIQENIISGSAFSARLGSAARPWLLYSTAQKSSSHNFSQIPAQAQSSINQSVRAQLFKTNDAVS